MPNVTTPNDPRLAPFIAMRDRDLRRETGLCLAEGEHVVRRAFEAGLNVRSVLVVEHKADRVAAMLVGHRCAKVGQACSLSSEPTASDDGQDAHPTKPSTADTEILTCTKAVIADAVGFDLHQGMVAAVEPPAAWDGLDGLACAARHAEAQGRPTLLVCPEITNAENLGLLTRVAAGLGVGAMVLGPRCADPWYRRAVRVSMGAVFKLPMVRLGELEPGLNALREQHGYTLVATVTDPQAAALDQLRVDAHAKHAVLLGSEGYGLSDELIKRCDERARIPMHAGVDSLNVAVATGITLYHLARPGLKD